MSCISKAFQEDENKGGNTEGLQASNLKYINIFKIEKDIRPFQAECGPNPFLHMTPPLKYSEGSWNVTLAVRN